MTRRVLVLVSACALGGCSSVGLFSREPPVYAVFFDAHDVTLTADGKTIVDNSAAVARAHPGQIVEVSGPSTKAAPGYDSALAQARIRVVEQTLVADGVAPTRMFRAPSPLTDLKAGASGRQRVEIRLKDATAK